MKRTLIIFLLALGWASCDLMKEKEVTPEPEKPVVVYDSILTEEKLIGKWEATDVLFHQYENGVETEVTSWTKNIGFRKNGVKSGGWNPATDISFITFNADHTFSHVKPDGQLNSYMLLEVLSPEGNWKLLDQSLITLTTDTGDDSLDANWTYKLRDKALTMEHRQKQVYNQVIYDLRMEVLLEKQ